jgi:hypothetical protein
MNTIKRKKGRPTAFTPATRNRLIEAIGAGVPICHACAVCRVSLSGFHGYRAEHPKFAADIEEAVAKAVERHLKLIIHAAENGDAASSRWYLERTQPAHFARNKIEVTGPDGSPFAVGIGIYLPQKDSPDAKALPAITPQK